MEKGVKIPNKITNRGNSLVVQWLGLHAFPAFTAEGVGSIPGLGTKNPQATQHSQKQKNKKSVHWLMDKEDVCIYTQWNIIRPQKEGKPVINLEDIMLSEISQRLILYGVTWGI